MVRQKYKVQEKPRLEYLLHLVDPMAIMAAAVTAAKHKGDGNKFMHTSKELADKVHNVWYDCVLAEGKQPSWDHVQLMFRKYLYLLQSILEE